MPQRWQDKRNVNGNLGTDPPSVGIGISPDGTIVSAPWLNPTKIWVAPAGSGSDNADGLSEASAMATGYAGYAKIVEQGGGILNLAQGWKWGGPVPNQGMWIRGDGACSDPSSGWQPAVSCVINGYGAAGVNLFQRPGQAFGTAGGTNTGMAYSDRLLPALWLVKTEHLITLENITFDGYVYCPFRAAWDYNRDSSGNVLRMSATQAVLSGGNITFTVTLPPGYAATQASRDSSGNVSITIPAPSSNQTFPPWRIGQIIRVTGSDPDFPAGDYPVTAVAANLDTSADWSFTYHDGGASHGLKSLTGVAVQSHGCGSTGDGEYLDLKLSAGVTLGSGTTMSVLPTQYRVVAHTADTITVANPYAGKNNGSGTFPTVGTFTDVGDICHQERVFCPVQWPVFNNVSAKMPTGGGGLDVIAGSGPCFDFGSNISIAPQLDHSQFQGIVPADDPTYPIDPDRMAGVFMSCGSPSAGVGISINSNTCTGADAGYRILCGASTGAVNISNFTGDTGVSEVIKPPAVYVAGNAYTEVDLFRTIQTDTAGLFTNVVITGVPPTNIQTKRCGKVSASGMTGDLIAQLWSTYPAPTSPFENGQVVNWGDGTRWSGDHPAGRRRLGSWGARFNNLALDPSNWIATSASITAGQPSWDGSNNAVKMSGSGFVVVRPYGPDLANTITAGGRFIMAGYFNGVSGLPSVGNGLMYQAGDNGSIVFSPSLSNNWSWAVSADYVNPGWIWIRGWSEVAFVAGPHPNYYMELQVLGTDIYCDGITCLYVPASVPDADFAEFFATLCPQPYYLPAGMTGTADNRQFIADGGIGVNATVLVTPSGTATPTKNLPLLKRDGTVQAYIPTLPTNSALALGQPTVVPYGWDDGDKDGEQWPVPPGGRPQYTTMVSATDPAPDYLFPKFESTSGNIVVSHILGPPEFVNLNAIINPFASLSYEWAITGAPFSGFAGYLSTASDSNFVGPILSYETGVAATTVRLSINVNTNSLTGGVGNWSLTVYRNGVATAASVTFTSGTTGKTSSTITGVGGAATDDYALFWTTGGGLTGGSIGFTAVILVSGN